MVAKAATKRNRQKKPPKETAGIGGVDVSADAQTMTLKFRSADGKPPVEPILIPVASAYNAAVTMLHAAADSRRRQSGNPNFKQYSCVGKWQVSMSDGQKQVVLTLTVKGTQAELSFALERAEGERLAKTLDVVLGRAAISTEGARKH